MSALGIMSRGYLCPVLPVQVVVLPGAPTIVATHEPIPDITGTAQEIVESPVIVDASAPVPGIQGAVKDPVATPPDSPSVSGGSLLVPVIRSAEEE